MVSKAFHTGRNGVLDALARSTAAELLDSGPFSQCAAWYSRNKVVAGSAVTPASKLAPEVR